MLEALEKGLLAHSSAAMEAVGRAVARNLFPKGGVLALYGDLGAGKTTLVRGLAQALGIEEITSPSFNYYFLYKAKAAASRVRAGGQGAQLLHLDAYRLNSPADYPSLMIDELLTPQTLFVIEWPEKLGEFLPKNAVKLALEIKEPGVHEVRMASQD